MFAAVLALSLINIMERDKDLSKKKITVKNFFVELYYCS